MLGNLTQPAGRRRRPGSPASVSACAAPSVLPEYVTTRTGGAETAQYCCQGGGHLTRKLQ